MKGKLFLIFFKIGLFTLGGGPAMIPIVQNELVKEKKLISERDFLDSVAFSTGLPGAIIVNLSIFVGHRINGARGALASATGVILPAFFSIIGLASIFDIIAEASVIQAVFLGIRPTVMVLIGIALYSIIKQTNYRGISVFFGLASLLLLYLFKLSSFSVLAIGGLSGLILYSTKRYGNA